MDSFSPKEYSLIRLHCIDDVYRNSVPDANIFIFWNSTLFLISDKLFTSFEVQWRSILFHHFRSALQIIGSVVPILRMFPSPYFILFSCFIFPALKHISTQFQNISLIGLNKIGQCRKCYVRQYATLQAPKVPLTQSVVQKISPPPFKCISL